MSKHINEDKLVTKIAQWRGEDADRASSAGETRGDIKSFLEATGWEKTALSWVRKLDKMSEEKRDDTLRSFDDLRGVLSTYWDGNKTPDMFTKTDDAVEPVDDEPIGHNGGPEWEPDEDGDAEIAEEADDFDKALAEAAE